MIEKDLVIGAIDNLTFADISPWLFSLQASGYKGDICLVIYRADEETKRLLTSHGVYLSLVESQFTMAMRFFEMWKTVGALEVKQDIRYRYIVTTDVRDVKFQVNPVRWLHNDEHYGLVVATENLTYENEPWSRSNMQFVYGNHIYEKMKHRPIVCAGAIVGARKYVLDMMLTIAMFCNGLPGTIQGGGGPDQAALNVILTTKPWDEATYIQSPRDSGIIHLGTSMDAIEKGKGEIGFQFVNGIITKDQIKFYTEFQPKLVDGLWVNPYGIPYAIVHQYDRAE